MLFNLTKKGLAPLVGVMLLLIVAAVSGVALQNWYTEFTSKSLTQAESQTSESLTLTKIMDNINGTIYFRNGYNTNLSISDIFIGGKSCDITAIAEVGMNTISLGNCSQNLTSYRQELKVYTDKGVYTKFLYFSEGIPTDVVSLDDDEEVVSNTDYYLLTNSLRFNDDDSAYLSRTPGSSGNRTTWTWSGWIKKGNVGTSEKALFSAYGSNDNAGLVQLKYNLNSLVFVLYSPNILVTNEVFRDSSDWFHIVLAVDTRDATGSERVKLYVDGNRINSFSTENTISQNQLTSVGNTVEHRIGHSGFGGSIYYDGYLSEVHFIDGQALGPEYFGENDSYDVWIPKMYTETYGINGFYLPFNDSANLGKDYSGNNNDFTSNNLDSTDYVTDTPTNNYATINPLLYGRGASLSEGNLEINHGASTSGDFNSHASISELQNGKWYWEFSIDTQYYQYPAAGVWSSGAGNNRFSQAYSTGSNEFRGWGYDYGSTVSSGLVYGDSSRTTVTSSPWSDTSSVGDIGMIALDLENDKIYFGENGVWYNSGNPESGTGYAGTQLNSDTYSYTPYFGNYGSQITANFGQMSQLSSNTTTYNSSAGGNFVYTPPYGFKALSVSNINNITGKINAREFFDTLLYTGNGAVRNITGLSFSPDLTWIKNRDTTDEHKLIDSLRGVTYELNSDSTNAESTDSNGLTEFFDGGFELGTGANGYNDNTEDFVAWNWKAGNSSYSNTNGSITSTVLPNSESGFSIITYTGNGVSGATLGHGLNTEPDFMFFKQRGGSSNSWRVYNRNLGTGYLALDGTSSYVSGGGEFYSTHPSSTEIFLGTQSEVNTNSQTYVAYAFSEVPGYSKFGSYTGNGNADGPFIYTGFKPAFVMTKRTDSTSRWQIIDTKRDLYNGDASELLWAEIPDAEATSTRWDMLSQGFKLRATSTEVNAGGGTYMYIAFAEKPLN